MHLYVGFVTDDVFVFFVTTATDPEVFSAYSQLKERIYTVGMVGEVDGRHWWRRID